MFLNLRLKTFCHATEDDSKIERTLEFLLPSGTISKTQTTGHHGNPIVVYESRSDKKTDVSRFWDIVASSIPREVLLKDIEGRIDKDCVLHMRLDKQKAYLGSLEMVRHEDVVTVSSKIESYPKRRGGAIKRAREFFSTEA